MRPICNTIQDNTMSQLSCKFGGSKWNLYWLIVLMSLFGTNHVINEHENLDLYDPHEMLSEAMPFCSYSASLVNQNETPNELC